MHQEDYTSLDKGSSGEQARANGHLPQLIGLLLFLVTKLYHFSLTLFFPTNIHSTAKEAPSLHTHPYKENNQ